jgi:hypothetical protein
MKGDGPITLHAQQTAQPAPARNTRGLALAKAQRENAGLQFGNSGQNGNYKAYGARRQSRQPLGGIGRI